MPDRVFSLGLGEWRLPNPWFTIAGVLIMLGGFFFTYDARRFVNRAQPASAVVSNVDRRTVLVTDVQTGERTRRRDYEVFIRFTTSDGVVIEQALDPTIIADGAYEIGDSVPILYTGDNPPRVELNTFLNIWGLGSALFGVGLLMSVTGAYSLLTRTASPYTRAATTPEQQQEVEYYLQRARRLLEAGAYDQAIDDCGSVLEIVANHADALVLRGSAHLALGQRERAAADFQQAAVYYQQAGLSDRRQYALQQAAAIQAP